MSLPAKRQVRLRLVFSVGWTLQRAYLGRIVMTLANRIMRAVDPNSKRRPGAIVRTRTWNIITFLVTVSFILIALLRFPYAMEQTSLDWSWQGALTYFHNQGTRFGPQVIYTYGPLGYMMTGMFVGKSYLSLTIWQMVYQIAFACTAALLAVRLNSLLFYAGLMSLLFVFANQEFDSIGILLVVFSGMLCMGPRTTLSTVVFSSLALSFAALIKFTFFVFSGLSCLCVLGYLLMERRRRWAVCFGIGYAIGFAAFWTLFARQPLTDIPAFVEGSSEMAAGFSQVMAGPVAHGFVAPSVRLFVSFGALLAVVSVAAESWRTAVSRAAVLGLAALLVWKQAYVRPDGSHMIAAPLTLQILALTMGSIIVTELQIFKEANQRGLLSFAKPVIMGLGLILMCAVLALSLALVKRIGTMPEVAASKIGSLSGAATAFRSRFTAIRRYSEIRAYQQARFHAAQREYRLERISNIINKDTVDVFGDDVGVAILNGWNYHPRPTVQSFIAYTSFLEERNKRFVDGPDAPEFYVIKAEAMGGRLFAETDNLAFEAILARYEPLTAEKGYWLLKRRSDFRGSSSPASVVSGSAVFGEAIAIAPLPPGSIDEARLYLHRAQGNGLFGVEPSAVLEITRRSGSKVAVGLPPLLGKMGFMLNPPVVSDMDFYRMIAGDVGDPVTSISVFVPKPVRPQFQAQFDYTIKRVTNAFAVDKDPGLLSSLAGFSAQPQDVQSATPPGIFALDGTDVFYVHAPSQFRLNLRSGDTTITGGLGVMPGAFSAFPKQKTVTFKIAGITKQRLATLLNDEETASKLKMFRVAVGAGKYDAVQFSVTCTPNCDGGWSYWTGIHIDDGSSAVAQH